MINGIIDSGQKIVTNGLVLHLDAAQLRSYPGSGTTWTDLSGNGNNGTLTNGPTFNSGNGGSIVLDGVNDYVTVNNTLNIGTGAYTVSVWIKVDVTTDKRITWKRFSGAGDGYSMFIRSNKFAFEVLKLGVGFREIYCTNTFSINSFYNVTAVFNRSTTSFIYLNGVQDGTADMTVFSGLNITNTITYLVGSGGTAGAGYVDGNIYNILQYNRALSATEVLQNYNATKSRFGL
jgi:hypothetical protein